MFIELGCEQLCSFVMLNYIYEIPKILANPLSRDTNTVNEFTLIKFVENILEKLTKNKDIDYHRK